MSRMGSQATGEGNGSQAAPAGLSPEITPPGLLEILWRRRWIVTLVTLASIVGAFIYLMKATPIYTSTSRIYVEQSGPKVITEFEGVMTQSKNYLYTQAEIFLSTEVLRPVAEAAEDAKTRILSSRTRATKGSTTSVAEESVQEVGQPEQGANGALLQRRQILEGVADLLAFFAKTFNDTGGSTAVASDESEEEPDEGKQVVFYDRLKTFQDVDNIQVFLKKELEVKVGKKDDIISVSFDSPWPDEAELIVYEVVESYRRYQSTTKQTTAGGVLKILEKARKKADGKWNESYEKLILSQKKHPVLSLKDDRGSFLVRGLSTLHEELAAAQSAAIVAKATYEAAEQMQGDPERLRQLVESQFGRVGTTPFNQEKVQLHRDASQLQLELADLQRQVTSDHPAVESLESKIARIKGELEALDRTTGEAYLELARQQWLVARERETELDQRYRTQLVEAQELGAKATELAKLESEVSKTEKMLDILDDRIKEVDVTEKADVLNINILEYAEVEDEPSKPEKARIMGAALVAGLILGAGLALLVDWKDHRFRSADEITAILGVPVLGVVPSMSRKASRPDHGQQVSRASSSMIAEAYRTIRTAVYFGAPNGEARTILVTSPSPGDGKSTTASNLAIAMAQAGQRTLLMDSDFRKPVQHVIFEMDDKQGLSSVLSGQATLDEVLRPSEVAGLDVLRCGPLPPNPSEFINSDAFREMLEELAVKYDRVVIDSPPVMAVSDARILAAGCDITLLVLRAEKSTRKASEQARDGLLAVGGHLLGVVVNDAHHRREGYGYGYYGGYGQYGGYYGRDRAEGRREGGRGSSGTEKGSSTG